MAKTKIVEVEDGLKNAAIAVGSALGSLAKKVGLGNPPAVMAPKATKKTVVHVSKKTVAPKKKAAPQKKAPPKKAAAKRPSPKKAKSPAKKR